MRVVSPRDPFAMSRDRICRRENGGCDPAHELAHARRLDHIVNLWQRVVEMMLFFHPGVHWLSRSLRTHREYCADALAVWMTGDPRALASALESVAHLRPIYPRHRRAPARSAGKPVPFFRV